MAGWMDARACVERREAHQVEESFLRRARASPTPVQAIRRPSKKAYTHQARGSAAWRGRPRQSCCGLVLEGWDSSGDERRTCTCTTACNDSPGR